MTKNKTKGVKIEMKNGLYTATPTEYVENVGWRDQKNGHVFSTRIWEKMVTYLQETYYREECSILNLTDHRGYIKLDSMFARVKVY